jgi:regulatory protein
MGAAAVTSIARAAGKPVPAVLVARMTGGDIGPATIEGWALGYLGRYASSAENLRRVLLRRLRRRLPATSDALREATATVDAVVERCRQSGFLDDDAYAAARARSWHRRGVPARQIRARLLAKGVAPAVAAAAVADLRTEAADLDLAAACAFARRRRLGPYRRGAAEPQRELATFARAGFGRRVAQAVLACDDAAAAEALARHGFD